MVETLLSLYLGRIWPAQPPTPVLSLGPRLSVVREDNPAGWPNSHTPAKRPPIQHIPLQSSNHRRCHRWWALDLPIPLPAISVAPVGLYNFVGTRRTSPQLVLIDSWMQPHPPVAAVAATIFFSVGVHQYHANTLAAKPTAFSDYTDKHPTCTRTSRICAIPQPANKAQHISTFAWRRDIRAFELLPSAKLNWLTVWRN